MAVIGPYSLPFRILPVWILCKYLNSRLSYRNMMRFKMAVIHHVGFSETWFMIMRHLRLFIIHRRDLQGHHHTEFGAKMLIDAQIMPQKQIKWRPTAILSILPSFNYWFQPKFLAYSHFSNFKMAAVRYVGFSETWPMTHPPSAVHCPSAYRIWCRNFDRRPNYAPKPNLKWQPLQSWIDFPWLLW